MQTTPILSPGQPGIDLQQQLNAEFLAGSSSLSAERPALSGIASNSAFSAADLTLGFREIEDLAGVNLNPGASALYHTTGLTTAVYAVSGPLSVKDGLDQVARSKSIQDQEGVRQGKANIAVGGFFTVGAASMGTFRGLSIASALSASTASATATAMLGCGVTGFSFFGLGLSILTGLCGRNAYLSHQLQKELGQADTQVAKITRLQAKMKVDEAGIRTTARNDQDTVEAEGQEFCKAVVQQHMKACDLSKMTDEELNQVVTHVLGQEGTTLFEVGVKLRLEKARQKSIAELSRVMTGDGVAALKELGELTPNAFALPAAKDLLQRVENGLQEQKMTNIYIALVCALSAVALGLFIGIAGGWSIIAVASVLMLASAILMLTIDYTYFQKACEKTRPGLYDQYVVGFAQCLAVASVVSFVVLCALGVVTLGGAPGVIALFVLFIWICHNEKTRQTLNEREKRYRIEHPTLEFIVQALENGDQAMSKKMIAQLEGTKLDPKTVTAVEVRNLIESQKQARREALQALFAAAQTRSIPTDAVITPSRIYSDEEARRVAIDDLLKTTVKR